ncbi:hypothetical protein ACWGIB_27585 [Streptomyces xiamenensis]
MASKGIEIAEDGVAQVSMTDARAQLTRLIRMVREEVPAAAFTERDERRAYVVTPKFYEKALREMVFAEKVEDALDRLEPDVREQFGAAFMQATRDHIERHRPS